MTIGLRVPMSPRWLARDLTSFQTEYCDDYFHWAYWIALDLTTR